MPSRECAAGVHCRAFEDQELKDGHVVLASKSDWRCLMFKCHCCSKSTHEECGLSVYRGEGTKVWNDSKVCIQCGDKVATPTSTPPTLPAISMQAPLLP